MAKKKVVKENIKSSKDSSQDDSKVFAFLATFLSIIGFIIVLLTKRDNKYVMFYAKQSLVVFIVAVIFSVISGILAWIPFIGWAIGSLLGLASVLFWLISWIYALSGKENEVPIIGHYGRKFNF